MGGLDRRIVFDSIQMITEVEHALLKDDIGLDLNWCTFKSVIASGNLPLLKRIFQVFLGQKVESSN